MTSSPSTTRPATSGPTTPASGRFVNIDAEKFEQMTKQTGVVILDVRTAQEYAQGHIHGAVNLDVNATDFAQKVAQLDKNTTYLVHCRSGTRSVRACNEMAGLEFPKLYNLQGGFVAWEAAGKPVEK